VNDSFKTGQPNVDAGEIAAQQQAARQRFERLQSMNAEEFLIVNKNSSSSAKCLLANIRLAQWHADQNPENLLSARQLFQEATDAGSLEALFSLGSKELMPPGAKYMSPCPNPTYLVDDERLRRDYIERAAEAGYKKAIAWLEDEQLKRWQDAEIWDVVESCIADGESENLQLMANWRQEQAQEIPQWRAKAAEGDLVAATRLAKWLIGSADDIRSYRHPGFVLQDSEEPSEREIDAGKTILDYEAEAIELLELAANKGYPPALCLLASTKDFVLDGDRRLEMLQKAAFPENDQFKPSLKAVDILARARYEAGDFDEAERCLRLLIAHRQAPDDSELRLADLYKKTGEFIKAEHALRDHIRNRKTPDRAELDLARLIRSHLSDLGARNAEVLELLECSAEVDAEAAMLAGLMRLRGDGCESSRDMAKGHFDRCKAIRKLPGQAWKISPTADYVDLALALGWGSFYTATEELLKLGVSSGFKGTIKFDALQFSLDDAHTLREGNTEFAAIDELKSHQQEFGQVEATGLLMDSLLPAVLSEIRFDKNGVIAELKQKVPAIEKLIPKDSMVWNFFVGQLILARRVEDGEFPDDVARWSKAVILFEKVNQLENKIHEAKGDKGPKPTTSTSLRRWLKKKTLIALPDARRRLAVAEEDAKQKKIERAIEEERRQMISFLSHTLTSATTGGATTVRKIAGKLANAQAHTDLTNDAGRLAAQVSRMAMVESLVEVFKLYTADPKALRERWDQDIGGGFTVHQVVALAIRQALLRFYFSPEHEVDFLRLMPEADYTTTAREFMADVLVLDMGIPEQARQFIGWVKQHLPFLRLSLEGTESGHLAQGGPRAIVIFALTGEFLGNALKYAAAGQSIALNINAGNNGLELICRNSMKADTAPPVRGGKTGLTFIRQICTLIGAVFDEPTVTDDIYVLRALLPIK
jgi:hypothetical protein